MKKFNFSIVLSGGTAICFYPTIAAKSQAEAEKKLRQAAFILTGGKWEVNILSVKEEGGE